MRKALFVAAIFLTTTPAALASGQDANDTKIAKKTIATVVSEACQSGQRIVKTTKKTVVTHFSGRMVPKSVKVEEVVCN